MLKNMFKMGCLLMVAGLLSAPAWSADDAGMSTDDHLILARKGHGAGGGPHGPGDCDGDGPWWEEASMSTGDHLILARKGHGPGDGPGDGTGTGDCA